MYHKANLNRIIADYTLQPLKKIEEDTDRDRYMSPLEAKEYGIIDHIIGGEEAVFNIKGSLKKFPKVTSGVRLCMMLSAIPSLILIHALVDIAFPPSLFVLPSATLPFSSLTATLRSRRSL